MGEQLPYEHAPHTWEIESIRWNNARDIWRAVRGQQYRFGRPESAARRTSPGTSWLQAGSGEASDEEVSSAKQPVGHIQALMRYISCTFYPSNGGFPASQNFYNTYQVLCLPVSSVINPVRTNRFLKKTKNKVVHSFLLHIHRMADGMSFRETLKIHWPPLINDRTVVILQASLQAAPMIR